MAIDKLSALSRITAFAGLPDQTLARLAEMSGLQRIGRGATMFCEGERAHYVYAIVEGRVTLVSGTEADESIAEFLDSGDTVLIPPVLLDLPYMATGRTTSDVLALLIPAADFRRLAETDLSFATAINRILAGHWRLLLKHLQQAKTRTADTRIAQYLLDNVENEAATQTFSLPGSKRQLAAHLGVTPETLSRSFKRLGALGVRTKGSEITVASVARLAAFANGPRREGGEIRSEPVKKNVRAARPQRRR